MRQTAAMRIERARRFRPARRIPATTGGSRAEPTVELRSEPAGAVRDHAVAAAWGAAEATCFFIVPDVWLSRVALRSPRRAAAASVSALVGAVVGGLATRAWARRRPRAATFAAMRRLPAINAAMLDRVEGDVRRDGFRVVLRGPVRGVPYKLYAREAGLQGVGVAPFVGWSLPARLPRFVLVAGLGAGLARLGRRILPAGVSDRIAPTVHTVVWIAFYAWYLSVVGREPRRA